MTAERWSHVRSLVEQAMLLPPAERAAFLRAEAGDSAVLAEAERLLSFDGEATRLFSIEGWRDRAVRSAASDLSGETLGHFRLIQELGRGGMGTVYLAERADGLYAQQVALKVLQEGIHTPALAERFRQERQILAQLQHPGIARLIDGGVMPDGRPYLVLEYVAGQPIDIYCSEHQLSIEARLRLFLRVAEAVQSAHQQLVLHLDIKPANILVTEEGEPRLLDFGIARILNDADSPSRSAEATLRLLTPRYASPEQAAGEPLGVSSDVFSLGTLLYLLLTGQPPYPIDDAAPLEAARMVRETPPRLPSSLAPPDVAPLLRGDLDTILFEALRKEPERRYPTVAAFAEDIRRHMASEPVLAHADSFSYRARKFVRRNRAAVIAATAAAVILVMSAVAVVRAAVIARRERAIAEAQRAAADRRLKDVRTLAHSYIFDLTPELEQIPGTVGIRNTILANSLTYLEAMARESEGDDDLSREIAAGYDRIGRVQARYQQASLGDTAGARLSMGKGIAIEKRLLEKNPGDIKERARLFQQMRHQIEVPMINGDMVLVDHLAREAWDVAQPILAAGPTSSRVYLNIEDIAWDMATLNAGNGVLWNFANPEAALPWLDREHEILDKYRGAYPQEEENPALTGGYEREYMTRADVLVQLGRAAEARRYLEAALHQASLTHNEVVEVETRKIILGDYATYLLEVHDVRGAAERAPASPAEKKGVKESDLTADDADSLALLSRIDLESGRIARGRQRMTHTLQLFEHLHSANPEDATVSSEMAFDFKLFGDERSLPAATRKVLYERASEVAEIYWGMHKPVLSAELLIAQCDLGLAQLAREAHQTVEQKTLAAAAIEKLDRVLAAHPIQPQASALVAQAKALGAS